MTYTLKYDTQIYLAFTNQVTTKLKIVSPLLSLHCILFFHFKTNKILFCLLFKLGPVEVFKNTFLNNPRNPVSFHLADKSPCNVSPTKEQQVQNKNKYHLFGRNSSFSFFLARKIFENATSLILYSI